VTAGAFVEPVAHVDRAIGADDARRWAEEERCFGRRRVVAAADEVAAFELAAGVGGEEIEALQA
jgi:hypothetical protein